MGEIKKRKRRSADETRSLLLKAAEKELVKYDGGLEMTTLAKKAGLSEGLAYHYFKNRAGVIAAVVGAYFDRYESAVIDVGFEGDSWQARERQRVRALISFYCAEPLTPVIFTRLGSESEVAEVENRRLKRQVELASANIKEGQQASDISTDRDPKILGAMMLGAIRGAIMTALQEASVLDQEKLEAEIWAVTDAMSKA